MKKETKFPSLSQQYMNTLITATEIDDANDIFAANLAEHIVQNTAIHCFQ